MTDTYIALAIIGLAALIHASFQLGVSMLTLLSGHSLSIKRSQFRIFRLTTSFVFGASVMTLLLLCTFALVFNYITTPNNHTLLWGVISGLLVGIGCAVWFTYYRAGRGTILWIPRAMADFLEQRTKTTKRSAESFSLGLTSVIGEVAFIVAPLAASAYALLHLEHLWQVVAIIAYVLISLSSLLIVWAMVGYGHKLSRIQRWRERHKSFLQYCAASGLIILGAFTFVNEALGSMLL
jgi:hypothetical protein